MEAEEERERHGRKNPEKETWEKWELKSVTGGNL